MNEARLFSTAPTRFFPTGRVLLASLGIFASSIWAAMLRVWWMFDSHFPEGSIYYFDVNFFELAGCVVFGHLAGYLSDYLRTQWRRRGLSLVALLSFIIGFCCQLAYRSPLDQEQHWQRSMMLPAFFFAQLGITLLEIAARSLLTDFGFEHGQAHVHAVAATMASLADLIVYAVVRFGVRNAPLAADAYGWSASRLRTAQIGLAAVSTAFVALSLLSGEVFEGERQPWTSLFNVDDCPSFWRIALPYGFAAYAYHQERLVTAPIFQFYLGGQYGDTNAFWVGCVALMISNGIGLVSGALSQLCAVSNSLRPAFSFSQIISAVVLAAFSFSCWGRVSLSSVYSLTGIGFGFFKAVPFAVLGQQVPREQVGRCVSLMICFAMTLEQVVQGDFFDNFMDVYYPWLHVWIMLMGAGFLGSRFPAGDVTRREITSPGTSV
jgi:hypothetical protein